MLLLKGVIICIFVLLNLNDVSGQESSSDVTANNTASTMATPIITTTRQPWVYTPCSCGNGQCGCCAGNNLPSTIRQRVCTNVTYNPDDFAFNIRMYFNQRLLYQTTMSGKDPRPVCVPIRFLGLRFCARLSDIYMVGRNVHACMNLDGYWGSTDLYHLSFSCFRIGTNGVAVVKPEDGGGLPPPPEEDPLKPGEEDYDDSARNLQLLKFNN